MKYKTAEEAKEANKQHARLYYQQNKLNIKEKQKNYYNTHKEEIKLKRAMRILQVYAQNAQCGNNTIN